MLPNRLSHWTYAGLLFLIGLLFYANFRSQNIIFELIPALQALSFPAIQSLLPVMLQGSLPSFLHICFMCFISAAIFGVNQKTAKIIPVSWLIIDIIFECLQIGSGGLLQQGFFDLLDVAALLLGAALVLLVFHVNKPAQKISRGLLVAPVLAMGISSSLGSLMMECGSGYDCVTPVVLTYDQLRADTQPVYGNDATLTRPGKIYSHGQYLYVLDQYRGIHIFDQSDVQNPSRIAFIPIHGALEISIQGNLLYTNSFSDLLVIKLADVFDGSFSNDSYSRSEDVFGLPDKYQFIPDDTYLSNRSYTDIFNDPDEDNVSDDVSGIVIGFINEQGQEVLFGEFE